MLGYICRNKVKGLAYASEYKQLFSASEDEVIVIWDMRAKRDEVIFWIILCYIEAC